MVVTQNAPLQATMDTYAEQTDTLSMFLLAQAHLSHSLKHMDMQELWKADSEQAASVAQLLRNGDWKAACYTVSHLDTAARELYEWYYDDHQQV